MANDTLKLTDQEVLNHARTLLEAYLPLEADGYRCTTADLLNVLLGVAANQGTIEAVCADLAGAPDADTLRTYFNTQLCVEDLPALAERVNAALAAELPERVRRRACEVAIDLHDRPYYGKLAQAEGLWMRGKAKDGTTRFYRVATAYVIVKHLRVTLAIRFVLPGDDTVTILDDLLKRLQTQGIRSERLFLDRGFDGIAVMDYLTRRKQPALIACTIRGKTGARAPCARAATVTARSTPSTARVGRPSPPRWPCAACSPPPNAPGGASAKRTG
jgi:putative transposase